MVDFSDVTVLVIGDVMLDKYIRGDVQRMNPEAPVPLIDVNNEDYAPGGASNVAANITSLGAEAILLGVVGDDSAADQLRVELSDRYINKDYLVVQDDIPTIHKVRIYARRQQLVRFDYEVKNAVNKDSINKIIDYAKELVNMVDIIVISDYAKGLITADLMKEIFKLSLQHNIKVIIDPKPVHKDFYHGAYLITPNEKEARQMGLKEDINELGRELMSELNSNILITRGEKGMSLFTPDKEFHIPAEAKEVYDVTGAGDTVVAVMALSLAKGFDLYKAARYANHAAGIVVGKTGTSTITLNELNKLIDDNSKK